MAAPSTNKRNKKSTKPPEIVFVIVILGILLNVITDGTVMDTLRDALDLNTGGIEDRYPAGGDSSEGVGDPGDGNGDGNADSPGSGTSSDSGGTSPGDGTSSGGKESYGSGSKPNVPSASKKNIFLNARDQGISGTLTGDVLITTIFVSDKATGWSESEMSAIKSGHKAMTDAIYAEAKAWGVDLELTLEYRTASVTYDLATASHNDWYQSALKSAGLSANASVDLEKSRGVKEAPVLFYLDLTGRAFAAPMTGKSARTEYAVFYNGDSGASSYRHELYHLFGAKDYYYPDAVATLGKKYFPNSTMLTGKDAVTDSLTAYLIGWTDQLDEKAKTFLQETNWITSEYIKEENAKETYTGYVENWRMDNAYYTGNLVSGVQQGQGTMVWDEGNKYVGNWDYGQFHGKGTFTWANGASYAGTFNKGIREGTGRYTFASGAWYEGDFAGGKFHGTGTYQWTNGDRYVGQWVNDKRQGQGKLTYADGSWYEGGFQDGAFHGQGTRAYANGARYEGQWQGSKYQGKGKLTYASGAWYEGDFAGGKFHGTGTYHYSNGDRYEGQWVNDKRQGQGTYTYASGTQLSGKWEDNKFAG